MWSLLVYHLLAAHTGSVDVLAGVRDAKALGVGVGGLLPGQDLSGP